MFASKYLIFVSHSTFILKDHFGGWTNTNHVTVNNSNSPAV